MCVAYGKWFASDCARAHTQFVRLCLMSAYHAYSYYTNTLGIFCLIRHAWPTFDNSSNNKTSGSNTSSNKDDDVKHRHTHAVHLTSFASSSSESARHAIQMRMCGVRRGALPPPPPSLRLRQTRGLILMLAKNVPCSQGEAEGGREPRKKYNSGLLRGGALAVF